MPMRSPCFNLGGQFSVLMVRFCLVKRALVDAHNLPYANVEALPWYGQANALST